MAAITSNVSNHINSLRLGLMKVHLRELLVADSVVFIMFFLTEILVLYLL